VHELLDAMGLPRDASQRYPHQFSGAQRQRISIARGLALGPFILITDEPVSALDVSIRAQVLNLLAELVEEFVLTLLFVSHDLAVVRHVCDRVAVLYHGELAEVAPTEKIYSSADSPIPASCSRPPRRCSTYSPDAQRSAADRLLEETTMVLYDPTPDALIAAAAGRGLGLSAGEAEQLLEIGRGLLRSCELLDGAPGATLPTRYPRTAGRVPASADNPLNAWAWRCEVRGEEQGVLAGRTVAVKDIVPVAGMPMTAGSATLQGYVAVFDATVTDRVLAAGGTITGIATTEDMCLSGASVSAVNGQVRNPRDPKRSAGGSSSGVAALVGSGAVDVGIGADQGGSIRIPASLCGIYGMKATYGLIPYTGCAPIDVSLDHLGPMARTAEDLAVLLQAVAGFDGGLDPRQRADAPIGDYVTAATSGDGLRGRRIGVVRQGFGREGLSVDRVDEVVGDTAHGLAELGAVVEDVDVTEHLLAMDMHGALLLQGASEFMIRGHGTGQPGKGFYDERIGMIANGGMATHGTQLFASVKYGITLGGYLWDTYGGHYYARAQNLAVALRRAYDAVLEKYDLLVMPTTLTTAPLLPESTVPGLDAVALALDAALISNTCAFDHTGHPALSVPIGSPDQMPVGLMLVGPWYGEEELLRAAAAMEKAGIVYR
jgi:amidase